MAKLSYCPRCLTTFREADGDACPNLSCGQARPDNGWGDVLEAGGLIDRHYRITRVLAVGGAGLTYLAREVDGDGEPVPPDLAVKVLYTARASGAYLQRLATEAQILQELDHDNIVQCRGFVHRSGHEPYLVTLFERGGSLGGHVTRVGPLSARVAAGILRQVLLALDTAHQRGVVHRDLKPDNVLLSQQVEADTIPHVRVADFGIAKVHGGLSSRITKLGSFVGTPEYAAPEQFEQLAPTAATDVFACGGLFMYMLTGKPPVALSRRGDVESSYEELLAQIPPRLTAEAAPHVSDIERVQIDQILATSMEVRAEHRATAHQVIAALHGLIDPTMRKTADTLETTSDPAPTRGRRSASTFAVPAADVAEAAAEEAALRPAEAPPTAAPARRNGAFGVVLIGLMFLILTGVAVAVVSLGALSVLGLGASAPAEFAPEDAPTVVGSQRQAVQRALQAPARSVGKVCKASGPVVLTVIADPTGAIAEVDVDPGYLPKTETKCLEEQFAALHLADVPTAEEGMRARVAIDLGG